MSSAFFAGISQQPFGVAGLVAKAPLLYRDVGFMAGLFLADLDAAHKMMPTRNHVPLAPIPGRALVAVHCFEYRDTDIGPYNEVSIGIAVAHGRLPRVPAVHLARLALQRRATGYVVSLPVTTEPARVGGVDVFGFPKYLATIDFTQRESTRRCELRDHATGELILEAEGRLLPVDRESQRRDRTKLRRTHFESYPVKDGKTLCASLEVNEISHAMRLGYGLTIRATEHAAAEPLRRLRLSQLLQYTYVPRAEAILYLPKEAVVP